MASVAASKGGEGGVWLELSVNPVVAYEFHQRRLKVLPFTTQKAEDVHLTVLYLGKGLSDAQIDQVWEKGVVPRLSDDFYFKWGAARSGTWGFPVVMMDLHTERPYIFEALYRSFYAAAVEAGVTIAGTNTSPDKHNGYHVTIDKRQDPPYSEAELSGIKEAMNDFQDSVVLLTDVRLVRGSSTNILRRHFLK
jgi:hypothetical protein